MTVLLQFAVVTAVTTAVAGGTAELAGAATVPLSPLFTALPGFTNDQPATATNFADVTGGHAGVLTFELDDDFDAVQVGVINQYPKSWGVGQIVVAPSANYGGDPATGAAAYDLDGRPVGAMLPVQWSQGGANSAPPGNPVVGLLAGAAAAPGTSVLSFASTSMGPAYGATQPGIGWYAADGLGCIAPGTTVTDLSPTSVSLSAPVAGGGCAAGQTIWFSPAGLGPFGQAIPGAAGFGSVGFTFSDWVPVHSLPRTDGGFAIGGAVSGAGLAAGTTLAAIGYTSLTLSQPLASAMPAHSPVVITQSQALVTDAAAGTVSLSVADTTALRPGQTVSGDPGVAPGTHVLAASGGTVTLDQPTVATVVAGTALAFANTTRTSLPAQAGDTSLAVPSTSRRPLLHLRYFTQPGGAVSAHAPRCVRNPQQDVLPCEAPLGLPPVWILSGGHTSGSLPVDGVNFPARIGAGLGGVAGVRTYPSFFIRILGRHPGVSVLACGGYQISGSYASVSGEAGPARIGAAWATAANPQVPVSVVNLGSRQLTTDQNSANCAAALPALQPTMLLIQDFSNHNKAQVVPYREQVVAVAQQALQLGVQPVIYIGYVESLADLGGLPVAADGANTTTVPLLTGIASPYSGSPTLVTGPGVPDGTTAAQVPGTWSIVLSQPVSLSAGSVLHLSHGVAGNSGTAVQLSEPSFLSDGIAAVSAPGIGGPTKISVHLGSTKALLSSPASLSPGTLLRLAMPGSKGLSLYAQAAQWFYAQTDPWDAVQLDGLGTIGTDPANPGWMCDGCSTGGLYANDYGNSLIAARFVTLLQQLTGQSPGSP